MSEKKEDTLVTSEKKEETLVTSEKKIQRWHDCETFKDMLVMNKLWIQQVSDKPHMFHDEEKCLGRPFPTKYEILLNEKGFLTKRTFEGNKFLSKEGEFKCIYQQRACVEGVMEQEHAMKLFETLKSDENIMIIVQTEWSKTVAQNFEEKIPLRLAPFDEKGEMMVESIKAKNDFDTEFDSMYGMSYEKNIGTHEIKELKEITPESIAKMKQWMIEKLGTGDKNKRKRELFPRIYDICTFMLHSFVPSTEIQDMHKTEPGVTTNLFSKLVNIKDVVSVSIMDKTWGREDYLWKKLAETL